MLKPSLISPLANSDSPRRDSKKSRIKRALYRFLVFALIVILWESSGYFGLINRNLFPPPSALVRELSDSSLIGFYRLPYEGQSSGLSIISSIFTSIGRVLLGLFLGFIAALFTGFLISYFEPLEEIFLPIIRLLAPISPVAWIPLALILFGIGTKPAIFVVMVSVFFVMTIATVANIKSVKQAQIDLGRRYARNRLQIMLYIIFPAILPPLFLVLRINLFAAWMSVLAAEMVGVSQGLGAMVMVGRSLFNMKIIFIAMILIGLCGYLLDQIFLLIKNRALRWSRESSLA